MKLALAVLAVLCLGTAIHAQTVTLKELYGFACNSTSCPQGREPDALILASDGNFYGVTEATNTPTGVAGGGTIFKMTPAGTVTVLYTFPENPTTGFFTNGSAPGAIVEASDGLLYGAAEVGGTTSASAGTLWRIHKDGSGFQVLERFCTSCTSGGFPNAIISASDGNLYGTTGYGGSFTARLCQGLGCGVVFKLTTGGVYTVLHALNGTTETNYPIGITQASDGNFYVPTGSESGGGIFRVTPSGGFTILQNFGYPTYVLAALTQASNGLLYGYTHATSAPTVDLFSMTLGGSFQIVAQVTQPLFKQYGLGKILQASDGNLWSSAAAGGAGGYGRVFSMTTAGTQADSLSFTGTNGSFPTGALIQTQNGTIYGTTVKLGTLPNGNYASGEIYTITGLPAR